MLEIGTFILFNVLGFGTTIYGTKSALPLAKPLALLGMLAFLVLAFWMLQPDDVGTFEQETWTDGATTWNSNSTQILISDEFTNYLQWVYFGLAMLALIVFMMKVVII